MMLKIIVATFNPQIEHKGRARKPLAFNFLVGPCRPYLLRNQSFHRPPKICIDHQRIASMLSRLGVDGDRLSTLKINPLYIFIQ